MRLLAAAAILSSLSLGGAQTQAGSPPAQAPQSQNSSVMTSVAIQRSQIKPAGTNGTTPAAAGSAKTKDLPPTTPVVTLQGLCSAPPAKGPCQTVITRQDLDRFAKAFMPNVTEAVRARFAIQYARLLASSIFAEQRGLDKDPKVARELRAQLKLTRMRVLAGVVAQSLQEQAPASTDAEVQQYYEAHQDRYQQAQLLPMSVSLSMPTADGHPLDRVQVIAAMEEMRTRAVAGEDFGQLQKELYDKLQIRVMPPAIKSMAFARMEVQGDTANVFDLKPGEVSAVFDSPSAVSLVKLESKQVMPLAAVRKQIDAWLRGGRAEDQLGKFSSKVKTEFDLQYLGLTVQPDLFGLGPTSPAPQADAESNSKP